MAIEEIQEVRAVRKKSEANDLIAQGWKLIGEYERGDPHDQYIEYHLGLPKGPARLVNTKDGDV